jgi:hypothetical protein
MVSTTGNVLDVGLEADAHEYLTNTKRVLVNTLAVKLRRVYDSARTPSGRWCLQDFHRSECEAAYEEFIWAWNQAKTISALCFDETA